MTLTIGGINVEVSEVVVCPNCDGKATITEESNGNILLACIEGCNAEYVVSKEELAKGV